MYEFGTSKDVPVMQFRRYKPFSILLNWTYIVVFCLLYILLFMTLIYFYNSRNSSRTPVYSMSYNPAENCVLLCTVSDSHQYE